MLFNSYGFILLFLPFAIICYFGLNRLNIALGKVSLLTLSILFVGIQSPYHAIIATLSVLMNYGFYRLLSLPVLLKYKKVILIVGITFNIAGLSVFKYASDFALSWPLPLGISFYTFQQIAFLTDCYRGEVGRTTLEDHALFTLFFPKITQGPISYAHELIPSLGDISLKKFSFDNFSKGVYLFSIVLAKKVMIADKFAIFVDYGYSNITSLNSYESLFTILSYTFQLYFDFSGYSDMAVGVGYMFNIKLPPNFNSPYKAKNISDFWKRWHITLTRFLTKYIYIPLGGNRCGTLRTFVNILIVYLVSGLWHGTGCNFLI